MDGWRGVKGPTGGDKLRRQRAGAAASRRQRAWEGDAGRGSGDSEDVVTLMSRKCHAFLALRHAESHGRVTNMSCARHGNVMMGDLKRHDFVMHQHLASATMTFCVMF